MYLYPYRHVLDSLLSSSSHAYTVSTIPQVELQRAYTKLLLHPSLFETYSVELKQATTSALPNHQVGLGASHRAPIIPQHTSLPYQQLRGRYLNPALELGDQPTNNYNSRESPSRSNEPLTDHSDVAEKIEYAQHTIASFGEDEGEVVLDAVEDKDDYSRSTSGIEQDDENSEEQFDDGDNVSIPSLPGHEEYQPDNDSLRDFDDFEEDDPVLQRFAEHIVSPSFCSLQSHSDSRQRHDSEFRNQHLRHHQIWQLSHDARELPDVLSSKKILSAVDAENLQIPEQLYETIYNGRDLHGGTKHVCLHNSEIKNSELRFSIQWDLDSIVGFADSLAAFKHTIKFVLVSANANKIDSNLHFVHDVYIKTSRTLEDLDPDAEDNEQNEHIPVEVRKYHHRYFGKISHASEIDIFFVWPRYPIEGDRSPYLTTEEARTWTDQILEPAIRANDHQADNAPRPRTYDDAVKDSQAYREGQVGGKSNCTPLEYRLNPDYLPEIWKEITDRVQQPGFEKFRDVTIFFSCKGIKGSAIKNQGRFYSFTECFTAWDTELREVLDYEYLQPDKWYLDFARMFIPETREPTKACVLLWKKCCLEQCVEKLYGQKQSRRTYYNHGFLRDACNVTVEPLQSHHLHRKGLRFTQFYSPYKNVFDIRKQWPYHIPYVEYLCLDPHTQRTFISISGNTKIVIAEIREHYLMGKDRSSSGVARVQSSSQPNREEHRGSYEYWAEEMLPRVEKITSNNAVQSNTFEVMDYAWKIPSKGWASFLRGNMNKMAVLFEVAASQASRKISLKQAMVAFAAIKLLQLTPSASDINRNSALSKDRKSIQSTDGHGKIDRYGLGMADTMSQYGYGWFLPRMDWKNFDFKPEFRASMLFRTNQLVEQHRRAYVALAQVQTDIMLIDQCGEWLQLYRKGACQAEVRRHVYNYMAHLVLRAFRRHILTLTLKRAKQPRMEIQEKIQDDRYQLCREDICELLITEELPVLDLRAPNAKWSELSCWFDVYFGDIKDSLQPPMLNRAHWEEAPFRLAYRQAVKVIEMQQFGADQIDKFISNHLMPALFDYNRFFPNIDGSGNLMPKSKGRKEHSWRTIRSFKPGQSSKTEIRYRYRNWVSGTPNDYDRGRPAALPDYLFWSIDKWETYLQGISTRR